MSSSIAGETMSFSGIWTFSSAKMPSGSPGPGQKRLGTVIFLTGILVFFTILLLAVAGSAASFPSSKAGKADFSGKKLTRKHL